MAKSPSVSRIFWRSSGIVKTTRIFSHIARFVLLAALLLVLDHGGFARQHEHFAAGLLDFLSGRLSEAVRGDFQILGQGAVAQDFQHVKAALGEVLGFECLGVDVVTGLEARFQVPHVDHGYRERPTVVEAPFGDPPDQGHLAAFERGVARPAGPGTLPFMSTSAGFPVAGARSTTHPLPPLVFVDLAMDVVEVHERETPRSRSTSPWERSSVSALMVALTRLIGLWAPKLLVRMS